jgi:hypothetical protein
MLGRAAGTTLASQSTWVQRHYCNSNSYPNGTTSESSSCGNGNGGAEKEKNKAFSRTVGAILALHVFAFGAGLKEPVTIYFLRCTMGFLVGLLLRVSSSPHHSHHHRTGNGNGIRTHDQSLEHIVESGIAKIWLTGFAVSMLTSGVLFYPLSHSKVFTAMVGGGHGTWAWLLAPVFFLAVVQLTDVTLQFCCGRYIQPDIYDHLHGETEEEYDAMAMSPQKNYDGDKFILEPPSQMGTVKRRIRLGSSGTGNRPRLGSQNRTRIGSRSRLGSYNRVRIDSGMSNDVFFDCESQCTTGSINLGFEDAVAPSSPTGANVSVSFGNLSPSKRAMDNYHKVAKYENNKCVYDDGSPAPVQAYLCAAEVPRAWKHIHTSKAEEAWENTKRWRIEKKTFKIHRLPHSKFNIIKGAYSHHVHGYNKLGYPIVYEKPGAMSLKKCFAEGLITVDDMLHHYSFFMEFLSNTLSSRPEIRKCLEQRPDNCSQSHWGFMVVMDVSGLSLGILSGDVLRYLQQAGKVNVNHYPNSTTRVLLCNCPFWISSAFGTIKSILPENTQADILSSSNQLEGMRKYIDDDQIPKEFGGSSPYKLGHHPFEKQLENLVEDGLTNDYNDDNEEDEDCVVQMVPPTTTFDIPEHMQSTSNTNTTTVEFHQDTGYHDVELGQSSHMLPQDADQTYIRSTPEKSFESLSSSSPYYYSISLRHGHKWTNAKYYAEEYVFMMISAIHCLWCAGQGSLETLLPVWLLSPRSVGGLGYEPRKSAFALFTASIVLMWLLRSKLAKSIACIPSNAPMRGYRIGVGAEAVLLLLLPFIPWISNFDSMLVLTANALICASMFIASIIGRMSSVKLHSAASSAYIEKLSLRCDSRTKIGTILNKIVDFVEKGGFSYYLGVLGEMTGALVVTPIVVWSSREGHNFPLDASFAFYTGAALATALYMSSFSFRVTGGTPNRSTERSDVHPHNAPMRCSILRDIIAVSVSDMASMFEENNWSSSSALGRQGTAPIMRSEEDRKYNVKKI